MLEMAKLSYFFYILSRQICFLKKPAFNRFQRISFRLVPRSSHCPSLSPKSTSTRSSLTRYPQYVCNENHTWFMSFDAGLPDGYFSNQKYQFLGKFWRALDWKILIYFMNIRNVLWTLWIFYEHLVHILFIWYIFSSLGIMPEKKSGKPGSISIGVVHQLVKIFLPTYKIGHRHTMYKIKTS
jgi:hypothetical protein